MPAEFEALAKKIKKKGGADNPFAVARSILGSDKEIIARRGKKKKGKGKKK